VRVEFFADIPTVSSGFIPLDTVRSSSATRSVFTAAFWYVP
jgi:hypothetical protein